MNRRRWLQLSLLLNLVLTAFVLFALLHRPASEAGRPQPSILPPRPVRAPVEPSVVATTNLPAELSFHWNELMSDNFKTYRDNLRAVGCPEQTIRDIIYPLMLLHFNERQRALLEAVQARFWELAARDGFGELMKTVQPQSDAITQEAKAAITDVLGKDPPSVDPEKAAEQRKRRLVDQYAWLPEEKRSRLVELEEKYSQMKKDLEDLYPNTLTYDYASPNDNLRMEKMQKLQESRDAERDLLFTPEEKAEYRLRSHPAGNWPGEGSGFEPTEAEWRTVVGLQLQFEDNRWTLLKSKSGAKSVEEISTELRSIIERSISGEMNDAIKKALGPERDAEYERSRTASFSETRKVIQRYGLPEETAVHTSKLQDDAQDEAESIRTEPGFSPAERAAMLSILEDETRKELLKTLGPRVFDTYEEYAGDWLKVIGKE